MSVANTFSHIIHHQDTVELLPELPDASPRNTHKLLEAYADLTGRTQQVPSAAVLHRLQAWRGESSLRHVIRLLQ